MSQVDKFLLGLNINIPLIATKLMIFQASKSIFKRGTP